MAHINQYLKADLGVCEIVNIPLAPSGGLTAGDFYELGDYAGIVGKTAAENEPTWIIVTAPSPGISVPKASGALTVGADIYYATATGDVSATNTDFFCGKVLEAAASGDARVWVSLHNYAEGL